MPETPLADRFETLLDDVARTYGDDVEVVRKAADLAQAKPDAAIRGVDIGELLEQLHLDPASIAAGLVTSRYRHGLELGELEAHLGIEVANLCEAVHRLEAIKWDRLENEAAESLRKMFLALASDVRVVLIALAARVHDMRVIDEAPEADRLRLARETMEVYAPLGNRLGVWQLKWELEDLAFRQLEPETYRNIKRLLAEKRASRTAAIEQVIVTLHTELAKAGVDASVVGRPKHIYSIVKKMRRKGVSFAEIYDVSAVRVIVPEIRDCYATLGLVHGMWTPVPGEFDDYIAKPKGNFYRSLHTAVTGPEGKPLEIQIRTPQMHEYNEFGVAAHWRYKEAKKADRQFDEKINWLRQLMQWQKEVTDPRDLAESLKADIFRDQVYVFTPTGDVVDLPQGSTPIDFAYRIHTQVGHRCRGAKVGGAIVPLDYELQTGDHVEIITTKSGRPSRDWLNPHLGYVRTSSARQKIRQFYRAQEREQSIAQGRDLVDHELRRLGLDAKKAEDIAAIAGKYKSVDDFLAAVGFGDISVQGIATRLLEQERKDDPTPPQPAQPNKPRRRAASVSVAGVDDVMSQPARCCNPVPGDEVVGFITRGRGVMIHRSDCPNVRNHPEPDRWMPLRWSSDGAQSYPVAIQIIGHDQPGLLRDVTNQIASEGINISSSATRSGREDTAIVDITLQIRDSTQVVRLLGKLEQLSAVLFVRRLSG